MQRWRPRNAAALQARAVLWDLEKDGRPPPGIKALRTWRLHAREGYGGGVAFGGGSIDKSGAPRLTPRYV